MSDESYYTPQSLTCCKCEEYGWDDKYEVVDVDDDNNGYCLLHSPDPDKRHSEVMILTGMRLGHALCHGEICDMRGVIFTEDVYITQTDLPGVNFSDAVFNIEVSFWKTRFFGPVNFSNAQFKGYSDFQEATFKNIAKFDLISCNMDMLFGHSNFMNIASFNGAKFMDEARFSTATFNNVLLFQDVAAHSNVEFSEAEFKALACFDGSHFHKEISFWSSAPKGKASFRHVIFDGEIDLGFTDMAKLINGSSCNIK